MNKKCPLTGKACYEHGCEWYIQVQGTNPQTGAPVDSWGCTVAWLPMLLIENSQQQRQTAAAVESARNEAVRDRQVLLNVIGSQPVGHLLAVQDYE